MLRGLDSVIPDSKMSEHRSDTILGFIIIAVASPVFASHYQPHVKRNHNSSEVGKRRTPCRCLLLLAWTDRRTHE